MASDLDKSLDAWRGRGKSFLYHGHDVFYMDEGEGEPLVCIHGFPTASWDWEKIWPDLCTRFRVIAPDMMGFGFTEKPVGYAYSLLDQATLMEALMNELGITRAHFLCHDYGDSVGQELLARDIDGQLSVTIQSMCLLNGGIFPGVHRPRLIQLILKSPIGWIAGRFLTEKKFHKDFAVIFGSDTQPSDEELHQFWQLIAHNDGQRIMHKLIHYLGDREQNKERWVKALQETSVPLRFINGPEDPISGRHMGEEYVRLVPNPDVVYLETIGHYPQVEAPEATLQAFLAFVDGVE